MNLEPRRLFYICVLFVLNTCGFLSIALMKGKEFSFFVARSALTWYMKFIKGKCCCLAAAAAAAAAAARSIAAFDLNPSTKLGAKE